MILNFFDLKIPTDFSILNYASNAWAVRRNQLLPTIEALKRQPALLAKIEQFCPDRQQRGTTVCALGLKIPPITIQRFFESNTQSTSRPSAMTQS